MMYSIYIPVCCPHVNFVRVRSNWKFFVFLLYGISQAQIVTKAAAVKEISDSEPVQLDFLDFDRDLRHKVIGSMDTPPIARDWNQDVGNMSVSNIVMDDWSSLYDGQLFDSMHEISHESTLESSTVNDDIASVETNPTDGNFDLITPKELNRDYRYLMNVLYGFAAAEDKKASLRETFEYILDKWDRFPEDQKHVSISFSKY